MFTHQRLSRPSILGAIGALLLFSACTTGVEIIDPDQSIDPAKDMSAQADMARPDLSADKDQAEEMTPTPKDMGEDQAATPDLGSEDMAPDLPPDMTSPDHPTRYPETQLISPMTPSVAASLRQIYQRSASLQDDVFMKVGASGTVSTRLLHCFAPGSTYQVDLAGRAQLESTITYFNGGDAASSSPFDRETLAAISGRTASWAISGSPSPIDQEIAAIKPRFAFINYGTNDMQQGSTYHSAMQPFYDNMTKLLDELIAQGIIPIITGLNPRSDKADAARWVPSYNALTRALAEARQVPFIDLYHASVELPSQGLLSDGIHGNAYSLNGKSEPCVFTQEGLAFNYNIRNLLSLQALGTTKALTLDNAQAPDTALPWLGQGSPAAPYLITALPFTHSQSTADSPHSLLDAYPSCDSGQDESGPERYYKLTLSERTPVRIMVFDSAGVDIDVHLLDAQGDPTQCLERDDKIIERTLDAGDYIISLDTFVSRANGPQAGAYTFVVVACEAGDTACN